MPAPMVTAADLNTLTDGADIETLKKQLPHVDLETGLKHRIIKRDPISGLGQLPKEHIEIGRNRTSSVGRKAFNSTLIAWDADSAVVENDKPRMKSNRGPSRNPIALTGDLGNEVDSLRTTSRPRTGTPREPQRDPISGQGNFGDREWDPIGKYSGKTRRAKSSSGVRSNPLTGENVKTFTVMVEEKITNGNASSRRNVSTKNIFTGENCQNYTVSPELKSPAKRAQKEPPRNAITGENCMTYDYNSEVRTSRRRDPVKSSNPLIGENMTTFFVSQEERPRTVKPYVYKNTVTGENVSSYKITPIERNVTPRPLTEKQNPLSGENMQTYTYRVGEGKRNVKRRDLSSPLTGDGSRGRTYTVSIEEKHSSQPNLAVNGNDSSRVIRNILTGENCSTYDVCQEMRSEKLNQQSFAIRRPISKSSYNIITGQ